MINLKRLKVKYHFHLSAVLAGLVLLQFFSFRVIASNNLPEDYIKVGEANLSVLWWDVYDAKLLTKDGRYTYPEFPLILSITYNRNIKSSNLVDETESQWDDFNINNSNRDLWLEQLSLIWPDVKDGDNITFYIDENGNCYFHFNNQYIGSVKDPEFSKVFLDIWLSEEGNYPKMTSKLKGQSY